MLIYHSSCCCVYVSTGVEIIIFFLFSLTMFCCGKKGILKRKFIPYAATWKHDIQHNTMPNQIQFDEITIEMILTQNKEKATAATRKKTNKSPIFRSFFVGYLNNNVGLHPSKCKVYFMFSF